jgi:hypothetical protein
MLSMSAGVGVVYNVFAVARLIKHFGLRRMLLASALAQAAVLATLPLFQSAPFLVLVGLQSILQVASTTGFTCTISCVNNVCARYSSRRNPRSARTHATACCVLRAACCLLPAACCLLPSRALTHFIVHPPRLHPTTCRLAASRTSVAQSTG